MIIIPKSALIFFSGMGFGLVMLGLSSGYVEAISPVTCVVEYHKPAETHVWQGKKKRG